MGIRLLRADGKELESDDPFAFLDANPLDDSNDTPAQTVARIVDKVTRDLVPQFEEPCVKCGGSGRFRSWSGRTVGNCFTCKGTGKQLFATSKEVRTKSRESAASRKERDGQANLESFAACHPIEMAWIDENTFKPEPFEFAVSMRDTVRKHGNLSDGQIAAVRRCILAREAKIEERKNREESAKEIDTTALVAAFAKASTTLKTPRFTCGPFTVSKAPMSGKNAGALYVKNAGQYLGKITGGKFIHSRECTPELETQFREMASDPKAAAIRHGRLTGNCACCGRELTNKESVELGIGPICASKWF